MFRLDRSRHAGRFLEWKVRLFTVGAVMALAGMFMDERWLVGAATVVLAAGLMLRLFPGGSPDPDADEGGDEADAGPT